MDQFDPEKSGEKVFTVPLIRLRGVKATQNLLINPGGPGWSGLEVMYRWGEQLTALVGSSTILASSS